MCLYYVHVPVNYRLTLMFIRVISFLILDGRRDQFLTFFQRTRQQVIIYLSNWQFSISGFLKGFFNSGKTQFIPANSPVLINKMEVKIQIIDSFEKLGQYDNILQSSLFSSYNLLWNYEITKAERILQADQSLS